MGKLSATAVKAARGDQDEELEIPPREMERIVHEMMTREYTRTLDEAVPALGDKTPRALPAPRPAGPRSPTGSNISKMVRRKQVLATQWPAKTSPGCGTNSRSVICGIDGEPTTACGELDQSDECRLCRR